MVDYSTYTIFALLNILWETWEQVHALDALIQIDNSDVWRQQRRTCFQNIYELRRVLREKLTPELPPMVPLMLRYQNMKIYTVQDCIMKCLFFVTYCLKEEWSKDIK